MMHKLTLSALALFMAGTAHAGMPTLNFTCPTGIEFHADEGGYVYINGKPVKLKRYSDTAYDAIGQDVTISITLNPDGTTFVSYTGKHGVHGNCTEQKFDLPSTGSSAPAAPSTPAPAAPSAPPAEKVAPGNMPAYCRGEASSLYHVRPQYIKTGHLVRHENGDYTVNGTADLGKSKKSFACGFDRAGKFMGLSD
jgi:hypothetical protein